MQSHIGTTVPLQLSSAFFILDGLKFHSCAIQISVKMKYLVLWT